jgi:hypothetical protein
MRDIKKHRTARTLCEAYADAWSSAQTFGTSHDALLANLARIRARYTHLTQRDQAYAAGYEQALRDFAYRHALIYGGFLNGQFLSTHSHRPDYYQKHGVEPSAWAEAANGGRVEAIGHYWETNSEKKVFKPFFTGAI